MRDKSVTSWFEMYNSFRRRHFPHILFPSSDQHVRNELGLVEQLFIIVSKTASAEEPRKTYLEATTVNPMGRPFIPANPGIEIAGTWSPDHIPPISIVSASCLSGATSREEGAMIASYCCGQI
jgi:hypothetical protein